MAVRILRHKPKGTAEERWKEEFRDMNSENVVKNFSKNFDYKKLRNIPISYLTEEEFEFIIYYILGDVNESK
ncbi:hypothetical protein [Acidianus hospitalis]|uniref:hypothetical protein n=1 Tax=Acidianus hospitalis TaxID=563177 RepID=UPI00064E57EF|nr:hypothetical protein [Acidianus hospitalis]